MVVVAGVYAVLGSLHEECRLHAASGLTYDQYRREVLFMLPCVLR